MTDHLDDDPNCDAAYDGEQCELALGHTGDHMSHNDDWPATVRDASRQAAGQPAAEPVDPTAAIEIWARMLCAADAHVYGGEHPTWQRLPSEKVRDDYRKAARWLLPRMTVSGYRPPADPTAAEAAPTNHDTEPPLRVWQVVREDEHTAYNLYGTEDDAKHGSINCWLEEESPRNSYSWRPFGDGLELLVDDKSAGIVINRLPVYGRHFAATRAAGAES